MARENRRQKNENVTCKEFPAGQEDSKQSDREEDRTENAPTNGEKQDAKDGPEEEQLTGPSESSALMGSAAADRRAPANRSVSTS